MSHTREHRRHTAPLPPAPPPPPVKPTANINGPYSGTEGTNVVLNYAASFDPVGTGKYHWHLDPGDGGAELTGAGAAPWTISRLWAAGSYTPRFWVVSDSSGLVSAVVTTTVTVAPVATAVASVTLDKSTATGAAGTTLTLTAKTWSGPAGTGTQLTGRDVTWDSINPSIADVPAGFHGYTVSVTLKAQGTANLEAWCEGINSPACVITVTPAQTGGRIFTADFETGALPPNNTLQVCSPVNTHCLVYTKTAKPSYWPDAPDPRQGNYAVALSLYHGDGLCGGTKNARTQLAFGPGNANAMLRAGSTYWLHYSEWWDGVIPTAGWYITWDIYAGGYGNGCGPGGHMTATANNPDGSNNSGVSGNWYSPSNEAQQQDGARAGEAFDYAQKPRLWYDFLLHLKVSRYSPYNSTDKSAWGFLELWSREVPNITSPGPYINRKLKGATHSPAGPSGSTTVGLEEVQPDGTSRLYQQTIQKAQISGWGGVWPSVRIYTMCENDCSNEGRPFYTRPTLHRAYDAIYIGSTRASVELP